MTSPDHSLSNAVLQAWDVFLLFTIPIGGGIPAGVILAQNRGFGWPVMMVLYLLSDIALACVFEPLMKLILHLGKNSPGFNRFREVMRASVLKTTSKYGVNPSPYLLILISFGVDPMTGRTAALAAGHGFLAGWAIAIAGDLIYFSVIMVSTLWLNSVLGDGTWTMVLIMIGMMLIPGVIRRFRDFNSPRKNGDGLD